MVGWNKSIRWRLHYLESSIIKKVKSWSLFSFVPGSLNFPHQDYESEEAEKGNLVYRIIRDNNSGLLPK